MLITMCNQSPHHCPLSYSSLLFAQPVCITAPAFLVIGGDPAVIPPEHGELEAPAEIAEKYDPTTDQQRLNALKVLFQRGCCFQYVSFQHDPMGLLIAMIGPGPTRASDCA
jgi:hypothetical protein